jgi:peptidoglycan/LPS O-acetylase OafA/YrhL
MRIGIESRTGSARIPELDGLRGLAIFSVVVCHYVSSVPHGRSHSLGSMIGTVLGLGAAGVNLFFILSGFLIGGILLDSNQSPNYYRTFYLRRFHRIFPVYYLWTGLFALISLTNSEFRLLTPYWVYLAFLQNYFLQHSAMELTWFGVMWSLGIEEQFYLLAPPLIRNATPQRLWKVLLAVLAFAFFLRLFLAIRFGHAEQGYWGLRAATFWMPSRADDLAVGMLVAVAWRNDLLKQWIAAHLAYFRCTIIICGTALLVTLPWMLKPNYFFPTIVGIPVFSFLCMSLLLLSLLNKQHFFARVCRWWALRELGKISYCVYVIHVAVNWAVHKYVRGDLPRFDSFRAIAITLLAFGVSLFIAELSWASLEHPLIKRGHRYSY